MNEPVAKEMETILSELKSLGFSEYEARVYVALTSKSPATAYEISNLSGVPRPNTYSVLKALTARNAVMPVSTNPTRYVPQPAERLFGSIAEKTRETCNTVAERLADFAVDRSEDYVWTLSGDSGVHEKVDEMLGAADTNIWIKADVEFLRRHQTALRNASKKRKVRIVIILYGDNPEEFKFNERCEVYQHEGNGFPMGFADNHFTLTVDNREMLTANTDRTIVATHTESRPVVKMAVSLLRHDFYMAEIFRVLGSQIDAEFGENLLNLRQRCYSSEQFSMFEDRRHEHETQPHAAVGS